jgi:hypothetical protein
LKENKMEEELVVEDFDEEAETERIVMWDDVD